MNSEFLPKLPGFITKVFWSNFSLNFEQKGSESIKKLGIFDIYNA